MSEEIKEILDWLKDYNRDRPFGTSIYDRKILSNYITNLQQKIEQLENIRKEAIEYVKNNCLYEEEYDYDEEDNLIWKGAYDYKAQEDLLDILNKGE